MRSCAAWRWGRFSRIRRSDDGDLAERIQEQFAPVEGSSLVRPPRRSPAPAPRSRVYDQLHGHTGTARSHVKPLPGNHAKDRFDELKQCARPPPDGVRRTVSAAGVLRRSPRPVPGGRARAPTCTMPGSLRDIVLSSIIRVLASRCTDLSCSQVNGFHGGAIGKPRQHDIHLAGQFSRVLRNLGAESVQLATSVDQRL